MAPGRNPVIPRNELGSQVVQDIGGNPLVQLGRLAYHSKRDKVSPIGRLLCRRGNSRRPLVMQYEGRARIIKAIYYLNEIEADQDP